MKAKDVLLKIVPLVVILLLIANGCGTGSDTGKDSLTTQQQAFDMLDRYGTWIDIPAYGTVWRPSVAADWRPYLYGHWVWSDQGWVWVGYEPFAWVVYHYGSWYNDRGAGWVWVPAYDWSPAQVAWASSDDYVAWAPLPPQGASMVQPGDPYWDQMWVLVPVARFRDQNVGTNNQATTSGGSGRVRGSTGTPPDYQRMRKVAVGNEGSMRIDLEKISSGGRTLQRLKLPPEQEKIVETREPEVWKKVLGSGNEGDRNREEDLRVRPAEPVVRDVPPANPQPAPPPVIEAPARQREAVDKPEAKPAANPETPLRQAEKKKPAKTQEAKSAAPHKAVKPATPAKEEKPKEKPKETDSKDTPK